MLSLSLETLALLMLVAFIIGIMVGASLNRPTVSR
jgi:hypothetical protein